ncbi:MAG: NADH-quinone oxidoreductase subunit C [Phycisphaerales bacterium]
MIDHAAPADLDCVYSSRVRLARNLVGFKFVNRSTPEELADVVHRVQATRFGGPFEAGTRWVNVQATAPVDRLLLFERNLISRPFVESPHPRCVAISGDESTSVMVNEEDHLRLQMLARLVNSSNFVGINVKCDLDDHNPVVETWVPVYAGANWHERETHEMFGISFAGHPDLRNMYLPTEFEGHPLRKDFPLLARMVKPWPGIVDVEPLPGGGDDEEGDES